MCAGCICLVEGGLLDQVNEVVWECGLGPDCSMWGVSISLGGICCPKTTAETIFASGCVCTCVLSVCVRTCVCVCCCPQDDTGWSFSLPVFNVGICALIYIPVFACRPIPPCLWAVCALAVCFLISVLGLTTNVYTAPPPPPFPSPSAPVSLPFLPFLHHFTRHHQGLGCRCLHCKSGLTIRRWLDPSRIQKHLIYLFIFLSCTASRCIISDQGDIPTSKCYSLRLRVNLLTNKLRQDRLNEVCMQGCENHISSAPHIHRQRIRCFPRHACDIRLGIRTC